MPHLMNREMSLWAGVYLPHLSQSVTEEWELRHKYSHQGWTGGTANTMTNTFFMDLSPCRKRWSCHCLLLYMGVSFLSSYLNNPIWITSLILVRLWPKGNPDQLFAMFIPRVWPTWNMWISSSSWELLTALIGKCKGEGRMLTSREGLHVGGSRWAFNVQSNMHWYKVSKF